MKDLPLYYRMALPVLLFGIFWVGLVYFLVHEASLDELEVLQQSNRGQLEDRINFKLEQLNILPEYINDNIRDHIVRNGGANYETEDLRALMFDTIGSTTGVDAVYFGSEEGEFLGYARLSSEVEFMVSGADTNYGIRFYEVDASGKPTALKDSKENFPLKERPWYLDAIASGGQVWGQTFFYHAYPIRAAPTSMPIYAKGELIGVVGNNFFMNSVSQFLKTIETSDKDRFYILNEEDNVIASNVFEYPANLKDTEKVRNSIWQIEDPLTRIIFEEFEYLENGATSYEVPYGGEQLIVDVLEVESDSLPNWKMVIYSADVGMIALFESYKANVVIVTGFVAIALAFLLLLVTKKITDPIKRMSVLSKKMAKLQFGAHIDYCSNDEVGELAAALNSLSSNLEKTRGELNLEIEEKNDLNQRLELALKASRIGLWDWDLAKNDLYWDDTTLGFYEIDREGFESEPVAYERWKKFVHPDDLDRCEEHVRQTLENEDDFSIDFRVVLESGNVKNIRGMAKVIRDQDRKPLRMLGLNWDVTDEKAREAQLIQAKESAERYSEAKSSFLANMSHEIRTPMNGILGVADLLSLTELDDSQKDLLDLILRSSNSMMGVIDDILDFSAIRKGRLRIRESSFELHEKVEDIVNLFSSSAKKKGIQLSIEFDEDLPTTVFSDSSRMGQIVSNFLSNAIKFSDSGTSIKVSVSQSLPKEQIRISVKDCGIGIAEEKLENIFEEFYQIDAASTRNYGGSGLGLSISKSIAELLGGDLEVQSLLGEGSTFSLILPLKQGEIPLSTQNAASIRTKPTGNQNVLIVEDHRENQQVMKALLTHAGYSCELAENGLEAVELCKGKSYAFILMDLQMPVMDGYEATEAILTENPHAQIIAVSANTLQEHQEKSMRVGMKGFVSKPVTQKQLLETVGRLISNGEL